MSKTIIVPTNAHMSYIVSKDGYSTIKGNVVVDSDKVIDVVLEEQTSVNFTINPTPLDSVVTLTANGYTQNGNSITVEPGTNVGYNVEGKPEVLYAWDYEGDNGEPQTIYTKSPLPIVGSYPCDENGNDYDGYGDIGTSSVVFLDPTIDVSTETMITITTATEK